MPPTTYEDAARQAEGFVPRDDTDYGWVAQYARERYADLFRVHKSLDDKAATLVTYLGSGTGLLTLGSMAALSADAFNPFVVMLCFPAWALAVAGLVFAAKVRTPVDTYPPPATPTVIQIAESQDDPGKAQAIMIWQYYLCELRMRPVLAEKARRVERATWLIVVSVVMLALPLAAGLQMKLAEMPHRPAAAAVAP